MMIQYMVRLKNQLNNYQSPWTVASELDFLDCQSAKAIVNNNPLVSMLLLVFRAAMTTPTQLSHARALKRSSSSQCLG